jgi:hypothetical protein
MQIRGLTAEEVRDHAPRMLEIQHSAYAVEAALIGDDRIPPLHETEADLLSSGREWIAAFDGRQISGAIARNSADGVQDMAS